MTTTRHSLATTIACTLFIVCACIYVAFVVMLWIVPRQCVATEAFDPKGQCSTEDSNKCILQKSARYPPIAVEPVIENRPYPPMIGLWYDEAMKGT